MKLAFSQRGDTLVEVAMSLAILMLTLVTSYNIATNSYSEGMQAREHTQAIYLAQEQAEKLTFYRDQLVHDNPDSAAVPQIINGITFPCSTGCHFARGIGAAIAPVSGPEDRVMFSGLSYHIEVLGSPTASGQGFSGVIRVTWESAVTNRNTTEIPIFLADKRGIVPRDCSVAGDQQCV